MGYKKYKTCSEPGCHYKNHSRGLCRLHYNKVYKGKPKVEKECMVCKTKFLTAYTNKKVCDNDDCKMEAIKIQKKEYLKRKKVT